MWFVSLLARNIVEKTICHTCWSTCRPNPVRYWLLSVCFIRLQQAEWRKNHVPFYVTHVNTSDVSSRTKISLKCLLHSISVSRHGEMFTSFITRVELHKFEKKIIHDHFNSFDRSSGDILKHSSTSITLITFILFNLLRCWEQTQRLFSSTKKLTPRWVSTTGCVTVDDW